MTATPRLDVVAQAIAQSHSQQRVKKLLVYACHGSWESEPLKLNQYAWIDLLQTIQQIAPTFDRLQAHLTTLVKTLNKPAEYTLVANVIANCCRLLYTAPPPSPEKRQRYDQIAAQLQAEPDAVRIKKLLVCACHNVWENDRARLDRISLSELVEELHSLATTIEQLQAVLESIVKTLNRQGHYRIVAQAIAQIFAPLYRDELEATVVLPDPPIAPSADAPGSIVKSTPSLPLSARVDALLFDLRLEILKYANPLRAKLLLFSALHEPIDLSQISLLKTDDLDHLLRSIIRIHPTPAALELHLNDTAQQLKGDYVQTARSIARSLQGFYQDADLRNFLRSPDVAEGDQIRTFAVTAGKTELAGGAIGHSTDLSRPLEITGTSAAPASVQDRFSA
ncbi:hypothetical protein H6F67_10620 [Microcoleus sp. FACHB-1515]|uniref:hypothetical protein n=1 Tax=Cyanophyceae TaxID=3028117 RepID=UPI001687BC1C|nr:hypothetical protein [Microcoleus sp. FACHB-1515]MBD2090306.1 hypothetical protein [Microcoleus sp. FACHB-1515]